MNTVCDLTGIQQHTYIVYRPQGNGRAETAVRLTVDMLRRSLAVNNKPWIYALPWALWQLNDLPGVDGKNSPHKIVFCRDPTSLGDTPAYRGGRVSASTESWMEDLQSLRLTVQRTIKIFISLFLTVTILNSRNKDSNLVIGYGFGYPTPKDEN